MRKKKKKSWKDYVDENHPSYDPDYMKGFSKGGRINAKDGGCMQIKGWGKARKR
jgi:hypothetical protein